MQKVQPYHHILEKYRIDPPISGQSKIRNNFTLKNFGTSIFERTIKYTFGEEITKATKLIYPCFRFNEIKLLLAMAGTSAFLGTMIPIQQNVLRTLLDIAVKTPYAVDLYIFPLLTLLAIKSLCSFIHSKNSVSCKELRENLSCEMRTDLGSLWFETMTFVGFVKTSAGPNIINPTDDLINKTNGFCENLVNLINARISILAHFIGALYSLYLISGSIEVSLLGLTIPIPYLILISLIYAHAHNLVATWANTIVKKNVQEKTTATDILSKQTYNSLSQAKSIAFLNSKIFEINAFKDKTEKIRVIDQASLTPQAWLSFFNKIHWEFSEIIGVIAQLLKGNVNVADALNAGANFRRVVDEAGFWNNNLEATKNLEKSTLNLQTIIDCINEFEDLRLNSKIKYSYIKYIGSEIPVNIDLTISKKDQSESFILKYTLVPRKTYRIIGPSGSGKSTLLELLKGDINPTLGSGTVQMPKNYLFLPQIPRIIKGTSYSLMDSICSKPTPGQIEKTKALMKEFKFENPIIDKVTMTGETDWDTDLSPGQKQKIAIISCCIKEPSPLAVYLDEPFASMDPDSRAIAIKLLYQNLPQDVIIVYIEHKRNKDEKESSDDDSSNAEIQIIEEAF